MAILRVVDVETTSLAPPGIVIEAGWSDLDTELLIPQPGQASLWGSADVPPEVRAIHHIQPAEVEGLPPFDAENFVADAVGAEVFGMVAHNWDFESQWIGRHVEGALYAACTYKVALRLWPDAPSHGNMALLYWLADQGLVDPDLTLTQPAHRAGPDCYTTAHLLAAAFRTGTTFQQMVAWTNQPRLLPRCPIGDQWRGKPWSEVDIGFLRWMTSKPDMDADNVWNAQRELDRRAAR